MPTPPPPLTEAELFDAREQARIVEAAQALYFSHGIAEVTMPDLARYLRLPEHAVQRWFPSTELLVGAVMKARVAAVQAELSSYHERFTTAVEELLALRNWVSSELQVNSGPFFQQCAAHYPDTHAYWHAHMTHFPQERLQANLEVGIRQGLYRADLVVAQELANWAEQAEALRTAGGPEADAASQHQTLANNFLARIVTPAGALVARRLQEAAPYY